MLMFLFIIPKGAIAQPAYCVDPTSSWGQSYRVGSVQSVTYYKDQLLFSVVMVPGKIDNLHIHVKVPLNTANKFQSLTDATAAYNSSILGKFSQGVLAQTGCPILAENSNIILSAGKCTPTTCLVRDWSNDFDSNFGPSPRPIS